jgi:hypothetical protein
MIRNKNEWSDIVECSLKADLFDYELSDKLLEAVSPEINKLEKENYYELVISFHVDLLNDPRMDLVDVPLKKWEKNDSRKDKIYNLLDFQLDKIDEALLENELQIINASIQGEQLEALEIIKFQIIKKEVEVSSYRKKKNPKPFKIRSVVPSLPFTQDTASKLANERLSEIYHDLMKIIRDKKIMSEILEIEATGENNKLFTAFCEQYGELWLCTDDKRKALYKKLFDRIEIVINQHSEQDSSAN